VSIARIWRKPKTCGVGQGIKACQRSANHAIAVHTVFASVHENTPFGPVVVFMCDWHFYRPGNDWDGTS
jgi:hypothetical protein